MSDDNSDDGANDVSDSCEWPEVTYSDFVAERADAFGTLALKLTGLPDEEIRALGLTMLKAIVRSIRTPPDAQILEVPK